MTIALVAGIVAPIVLYLYVSYKIALKTKVLGDQLPLSPGYQAQVATVGEFRASTVATSISLATVVLAFYELAPIFGFWLFWCVATTAIGIGVARLGAARIWSRISQYEQRPTLHQFLGREYNSEMAAIIGAACTALGFLGAFAVELSVGSRFLGGLLPGIPLSLIVAAIAVVMFGYTAAGGFRAAVVTDVLQMRAIWIMLAALGTYYAIVYSAPGNQAQLLQKLPANVYDFSWREGLGAFLIGIAIINIPTFLSDMGVWQRIGGSTSLGIVKGGLFGSVLGASVTWSLIIVLACLAIPLFPIKEGTNPLTVLMQQLGQGGLGYLMLLAIIIAGLLAAALSTASTLLIATTHVLYEDIFARRSKEKIGTRIGSAEELKISRAILLGAAIVSLLVVELLTHFGFTIADLIFAVYGAQLGLFPAVALALFGSKEKLARLGNWAAAAIGAGFFGGWLSAGYGKVVNNGDLVFLSPAVSLFVSIAILGIGWMLRSQRRPHH